MSLAQVEREQRFRLSCVPWKTYVVYSDDLGPRHVRVTYDQGEMELMTLSSRHERGKKRLARLIEALAEEMAIDIASYGSMTCRREDLARALEPDECYWIANEKAVRGREDVEFPQNPPPDLAVEVEISRSTLERLPLYASLGVPEVWRWDGRRLLVGLLGEDGQYHDSNKSVSFPFLPLSEMVRFLTRIEPSETQLLLEFRAWVREQRARGWGQKPSRKRKK